MLPASVVAFAVILLDFITKYAVKSTMELGESFSVIPGVIDFTYVLNKGAAWGMLADKRWIFLLFSAVSIIIIAIVLWKMRSGALLMRISLALILGGGIGNMIDRTFNGEILFDGAVVDFIEAVFIDFPVFNVADCAVVCGVFLMMVYLIFFDDKEKRKSVGGSGNDE